MRSHFLADIWVPPIGAAIYRAHARTDLMKRRPHTSTRLPPLSVLSTRRGHAHLHARPGASPIQTLTLQARPFDPLVFVHSPSSHSHSPSPSSNHRHVTCSPHRRHETILPPSLSLRRRLSYNEHHLSTTLREPTLDSPIPFLFALPLLPPLPM